MDKEHFDLCHSEAKDELKHINLSIKETRNRIYFLLVIMLGVIGFFSNDFFSMKYFTVKSNCFYFSFFILIVQLFASAKALLPIKGLRGEGMSPIGFKTTINSDRLIMQENILNTYQKSIETNSGHLSEMSSAYKSSFWLLIVWLFFLFFYGVILVAKGFIC